MSCFQLTAFEPTLRGRRLCVCEFPLSRHGYHRTKHQEESRSMGVCDRLAEPLRGQRNEVREQGNDVDEGDGRSCVNEHRPEIRITKGQQAAILERQARETRTREWRFGKIFSSLCVSLTRPPALLHRITRSASLWPPAVRFPFSRDTSTRQSAASTQQAEGRLG